MVNLVFKILELLSKEADKIFVKLVLLIFESSFLIFDLLFEFVDLLVDVSCK